MGLEIETKFLIKMAITYCESKNEKALIHVVCMINQAVLLYCFTMVVYGSLFQRQEEVRHESTIDVYDEENYELTLMERVESMIYDACAPAPFRDDCLLHCIHGWKVVPQRTLLNTLSDTNPANMFQALFIH